MEPNHLFYIIVALVLLDFIIDKILDALNAIHFNAPVPPGLQDIYDPEEYIRSQQYKKTRYKFGLLSSSFSTALLLAFLWVGGFALVDSWARAASDNPVVIGLLFFGILLGASDLLSLPFSYYSTFVIEARFGFNKTDKKTFFLDILKGWGMKIVLGGGILALILWFYQLTGDNFWWYAWILVTIFSLVLNMCYARLIVPLFNKQTPLPEGTLREKIETYASAVGFNLDKIFVIDGSRRSTKANAYFSGFGREKRVTLYDTLIQDLEDEEIVAVLAHEVGHYKRKHIISNLVLGTLTTGLTLWLLSLFVSNPVLSEALGVKIPSFHIGLVAFGILYSPLSEVTGICMNYLSRKFEYQADNFAADTYAPEPLISGLKKLSKNSLSNLTPHPAYVFVHYSHPPLSKRFKNLQGEI